MLVSTCYQRLPSLQSAKCIHEEIHIYLHMNYFLTSIIVETCSPKKTVGSLSNKTSLKLPNSLQEPLSILCQVNS